MMCLHSPALPARLSDRSNSALFLLSPSAPPPLPVLLPCRKPDDRLGAAGAPAGGGLGTRSPAIVTCT